MNYIIDELDEDEKETAKQEKKQEKLGTHYYHQKFIKKWKNNVFLPPSPMLIVLLHTRSRLFFIFSKRPASKLAVFRPAGMRFEKSEKKPLACVQYHYQHGI